MINGFQIHLLINVSYQNPTFTPGLDIQKDYRRFGGSPKQRICSCPAVWTAKLSFGRYIRTDDVLELIMDIDKQLGILILIIAEVNFCLQVMIGWYKRYLLYFNKK